MSSQAESFKGKILVVDDTFASLQLLDRGLTQEGYHVQGVINGTLALVHVYTSPPDLILLDINMPEMNGYQVCQQLKADQQTRDIPIIFISAIDEPSEKAKAFAVGGMDYITKPFKMPEVLTRIEHQLTLRQVQRRLQDQNTALQQEIQNREQALQALELTKIALETANQQLQRLAIIDDLTQIANRRRFYAYLDQEWQRSIELQAPLSLLLCDVDYFKRYNDACGHQAGDWCLQQVAQAIQQVIDRPASLVARYGGEEFVAILPNTTAEAAMDIAQKMQTSVEKLQLVHTQSQVSPFVTLSIGIASTVPQADTSLHHLIGGADRALYRAKAEGRNRVVLGDD
jgi:diguanylate cyclase (GGDEF)-like protein